jgi:hypothetical protein
VKLFIVAAIASVFVLSAQESSVTTTTAVDINGHRVTEGPSVIHSKSDGKSETTEVVQRRERGFVGAGGGTADPPL